MWKYIIIIICVCVFFYLLYINGCMIVNAKSAIVYIGSGNKAEFISCTGYTKRVIRFKKNKIYHFSFFPELSNGEVIVELLDFKKRQIMCLDNHIKSADLCINARKRYYLIFRFKSATGKYILNCEWPIFIRTNRNQYQSSKILWWNWSIHSSREK